MTPVGVVDIWNRVFRNDFLISCLQYRRASRNSKSTDLNNFFEDNGNVIVIVTSVFVWKFYSSYDSSSRLRKRKRRLDEPLNGGRFKDTFYGRYYVLCRI